MMLLCCEMCDVCNLPARMPLCQLVGVVHVVPDAVETSGNTAQRIHEGVSAPDGEDGVLLAETLCGTDNLVFGMTAKMLSHPSA